MKVFLRTAVPVLFYFLLVSLNHRNELTPWLFETPKGFLPMPVATVNPVTVEGANLGRMLFYDPVLSEDSSISCASCHRQETAFSDGGQRYSRGINGTNTTRNTPALYNLAWNPFLFWDGHANSPEGQVFFPVRDHNEMNLSWFEAETRLNNNITYKQLFRNAFGIEYIDSMHVAMAIGQFTRTLISSNSKLDKTARGEARFSDFELRGYMIANDQAMGGCLHCHPTDAHLMGTTYKFSNNGLEDIEYAGQYPDKGRGGITGDSTEFGLFKIPSLRNVAVTGPYMHDGRFTTLEEVLDFYSEGVHQSPNIDSKMTRAVEGGVHLSDADTKAVIAFLHCLTDSTFLTDARFSNPWPEQEK